MSSLLLKTRVHDLLFPEQLSSHLKELTSCVSLAQEVTSPMTPTWTGIIIIIIFIILINMLILFCLMTNLFFFVRFYMADEFIHPLRNILQA